MTLIRAGALVAALVLADTGWAADTDVENSTMRELPLQRSGPIVGGRQRQPTPTEIQERAQLRSPPSSEASVAPRGAAGTNDDLYQRVLRQSQHPAPRVISPTDQ
ncbi:MAG: hypothetical protein WDO24_11150 [Pseudomonadota bacterium]